MKIYIKTAATCFGAVKMGVTVDGIGTGGGYYQITCFLCLGGGSE
jgi:hypothetical protein